MKFSVGACFGHCGGSARGVRLTLRLCCGVCHVGNAGLVCEALSVAAFGLRCRSGFAVRFWRGGLSSVRVLRCVPVAEIPSTRVGHCGSAAGWFVVGIVPGTIILSPRYAFGVRLPLRI